MARELLQIKNYGIYNYTAINHNNTSKAIPLSKLFILNLFTLGTYKLYWFYKNSQNFDYEISIFSIIGLLIPIVNLYIYYNFIKQINIKLKNKNLETPNIIINTLFFFIPILAFWSLINVQEYLNKYFIKTPNTYFTTSEKIGLTIFILIEISYIVIYSLIYYY